MTPKQAAQHRWRKKNPDYVRIWAAQNADKVRAYSAKSYKKHKAKVIAAGKLYRKKRRSLYNAYSAASERRTRERFMAGRIHCDVCQKRAKLIMDHDHKFARLHCHHREISSCTRCRRGAICRQCNTGIGMLQESLKLLGNGRAGQYVRRWDTILKSRKRG
jgi:recombination endonuclease VII